MDKQGKVKKALKGLDVDYLSHGDNGVIDMARVNGFSIVWHQWAYTTDDEPTVEVMKPFGGALDNVEGHFPISKLRELVTA